MKGCIIKDTQRDTQNLAEMPKDVMKANQTVHRDA